jgi:RNA polymerase sigma factor (sigma-70 family)
VASSSTVYPESAFQRDSEPLSARKDAVTREDSHRSLEERDALFTQFLPLVNRLVYQYGKNYDLRQDLRSELFCVFDTLLCRYDPSRGVPLRPYLVKQLMVCAFTFARKRWRNSEHEVSLMERLEDGYWVTDPTREWDTQLVRRQWVEQLPVLLAKLPPRQRNVVIWRYYEERSFEEIAEMLGIQTSSARSLLRHGLNRLREEMEASPSQAAQVS